MATKAEIQRLQVENEALRADNRRLRQKMARKSVSHKRWRSVLGVVLAVLAIVIITAGNLVFWAGNTVTKTDRFVEATAPVIEQPAVQSALAQYTTEQIFNNVDVESYISDVLPPRAAFLASELTRQLRNQTESQLQKVAASEKFQSTWQDVMARQHANLVKVAANYKGDGTINLNDVYQRLSQRLADTKLSFLAGKQLPASVGSITVIDAPWLPKFHNLVVHIDLWRSLAVLAALASFVGAVALSRQRRRALYLISAGIVIAMATTLIALAIGKNTVAGEVGAQYQEAARVAYQTVTGSLVTQTVLLAVVAALIAFIAWITGGSRPSRVFRARLHGLANQLHSRLFGSSRPAALVWLDRNKAAVQWGVLAVTAIILFSSRLTVSRLLWCLGGLIILTLLLEVLAVLKPQSKK